MKKEEQEKLIEALERELDTRDKRYMFLRMSFKKLLPAINIEGSQREAAWNIYSEFEKQCMIGSLIVYLNSMLDCDLYLTHD